LEWTASDGYRARVEVLLPAAAVPACGWPLVAWVHPLGSDRIEQLPQAIGLAGQGFAVAVYDVRGQGDFLELNDPEVHGRTLNGLREIVDLAEVIEFVAASFPADIDGERVGVTGTSQGGWHAWVAAACSDRLLPANPWREEPFPAIDAAVARGNDGSPWFGGPGKTVFTDWERQLLFEEPDGVHWQPEELALARAAFLADDPAALDAFPGAFDHRPLLPTTQVPLMAHLAHQDSVFRSRAFVQNAASLPAGGPRRFTLGSGVHGAPANLLDDADFAWQRVLFLREHLAAESPSGDPPALVAVEERWVSRVVPDASVALGSPEAVWDRRAFTQLPPAGFAFYLTGGGGLALQAPEAAFEVPLNYDPGAGFDPQSAATGALASFGFASDVRVFESPAAPLTTQLIGSPRFRGLLRSSAPSAQVSLRLSAGGLRQLGDHLRHPRAHPVAGAPLALGSRVRRSPALPRLAELDPRAAALRALRLDLAEPPDRTLGVARSGRDPPGTAPGELSPGGRPGRPRSAHRSVQLRGPSRLAVRDPADLRRVGCDPALRRRGADRQRPVHPGRPGLGSVTAFRRLRRRPGYGWARRCRVGARRRLLGSEFGRERAHAGRRAALTRRRGAAHGLERVVLPRALSVARGRWLAEARVPSSPP
jgi:hypothetical protein